MYRSGLKGLVLSLALGAGGVLAAGGPGQAAEPDGWLYVVNASAHGLLLVVDDARLDLPGNGRVIQPITPGGHGLAAVLGARTTSQWSALDLTAAGSEKGRSYWCFVSSESRGVPHLLQVAPADCSALVRAGSEATTPIRTVSAHPAPPLAR